MRMFSPSLYELVPCPGGCNEETDDTHIFTYCSHGNYLDIRSQAWKNIENMVVMKTSRDISYVRRALTRWIPFKVCEDIHDDLWYLGKLSIATVHELRNLGLRESSLLHLAADIVLEILKSGHLIWLTRCQKNASQGYSYYSRLDSVNCFAEEQISDYK